MRSFLLALFIATLFSCSPGVSEQTKKEYKVLQKMEGTWISDYDSIKYIESWTKMSDSLLFSEACLLQGADTLFSETVEIQIRNKSVFYMPTVQDQNEGKTVSFQMKELTDTSFIAENLQHDFPQRIVYTLKSDSLIAYIEGNTKTEKNHREYFRMKKNK